MRQVGVDANILLRAFLNDDTAQSLLSQKFLSGLGENVRGYVGAGALLEVFWVLRSRYRLPRAELCQIMRSLLSTQGVVVESFDAAADALKRYEQGLADFPDALLAARNREAGCASTLTFDEKAAARVPGMELLA
jgi:predicted nucleic-acid-binding protein